MKVFIVAFLLGFIVICISTDSDRIKFTKECMAEIGLSEYPIINGSKSDFENPKIKCFTACWLKKLGDMADSKTNPYKILGYEMNSKIRIDKDIHDKIIECAETANEKPNECDVAAYYMKCVTEILERKNKAE